MVLRTPPHPSSRRAQLPQLLRDPKAEYVTSSFFSEQLTAFEVREPGGVAGGVGVGGLEGA